MCALLYVSIQTRSSTTAFSVWTVWRNWRDRNDWSREEKKWQETVHKQKHTRIYSTHTNRSAHAQTHKAAEKSQRMPRHTKSGEYRGGVRVRRSGVRQRHHTAHSQHNPDLYSCSFVDFAKLIWTTKKVNTAESVTQMERRKHDDKSKKNKQTNKQKRNSKRKPQHWAETA